MAVSDFRIRNFAALGNAYQLNKKTTKSSESETSGAAQVQKTSGSSAKTRFPEELKKLLEQYQLKGCTKEDITDVLEQLNIQYEDNNKSVVFKYETQIYTLTYKISNIDSALKNQGLTLVKDDEYENNKGRTVAQDSYGNYYDYDKEKGEFILRTIDRIKDLIASGNNDFDVADIVRTVNRNINVAANKQGLTLMKADDYANEPAGTVATNEDGTYSDAKRVVAKDADGNFYDYEPETQEFVLRTVDRIKSFIFAEDNPYDFTVTDIAATINRNIHVAANKQGLTLMKADDYANEPAGTVAMNEDGTYPDAKRVVAKDADGNYYDYDTTTGEFVLRTAERVISFIFAEDNPYDFTISDAAATVNRNIHVAANKQGLTLMKADDYANEPAGTVAMNEDGTYPDAKRVVAKDADGNFYDYDTTTGEFVLRTEERVIAFIFAEDNPYDFTISDAAATVNRNIQVAAKKQGLTIITDEYEKEKGRTVAQDADGNYYDYNPDTKSFVLRTIDSVIEQIASEDNIYEFTIQDLTKTIQRNMEVSAKKQGLTIQDLRVAVDSEGNYYVFNSETQEFEPATEGSHLQLQLAGTVASEFVKLYRAVENNFAQGNLTVEEALARTGGWLCGDAYVKDGKYVQPYQVCNYYSELVCDVDILKTENCELSVNEANDKDLLFFSV